MPDILFPAGRMIGGNLDILKPRIKDGKPVLDKNGQPSMQCSVGLAIPKGAEPDWKQTAWGAIIHKTGAQGYPQLVNVPAFSWKVTDGDSTALDKNGKRQCDKAGYPGNWVLWFSQGWLPKKVNATGEVELPEGAIVPGFYIQVFGSVEPNKIKPGDTPGVYLNPIAVALVGEGERMAVDVDTTKVGFGGAALPAGAKPVTAAAPQFAAPAPTPAAAPPTPVVPNPAILNVPAPKQMTAKAAGAPYEAFVAQGWTDDMLRQQGYMV